MALKNQFYSLQGEVLLAKYSPSGSLGEWFKVGSVDSLNVGIEESTVDIKESTTGNRATVATIVDAVDATLTTTLKELNQENLETVIRGLGVTKASSVISDAPVSISFAEYQLGARTVVVDDVNVTNVVVETASATPVSGVDLTNAIFGVVELPEGLVTGDFPLTISYSAGASVSTGFLTQAATPYAIKFNGRNTVVGGANKSMVVDLYKISISPAKAIELLTSDAAVLQVELDAKILLDSSKPASNDLGQFGRVRTF